MVSSVPYLGLKKQPQSSISTTLQEYCNPSSICPKPRKLMLPSTNKPPPPTSTIKFLCSYGGMIIPRHPDGKLRYQGGETRVLAVHRSISFSELLLKLGDLCGKSVSVSVRCQLPYEDLDALVSITSDEDLANVIEEYDRAPSPKIRAFLSLPRKKSPSPHASLASSSSSSSSSSNSYSATAGSCSAASTRCHHQILKPVAYPGTKMAPHHHRHQHQHQHGYHSHGNLSHNSNYLVHGVSDWQ